MRALYEFEANYSIASAYLMAIREATIELHQEMIAEEKMEEAIVSNS